MTTVSQHRLDQAPGFGTFEMDLGTDRWQGSPEAIVLFGLDPQSALASFGDCLKSVFVDDIPKIQAAIDAAKKTGAYYVEFRVKDHAGRLRWLSGKGHVSNALLRGTYADINERKQLEARLLAVNESLEARIAELRQETHALEVLNRTGTAIAAELDLERLVQTVTDAGVELSGAEFGAFFYNVNRSDGEAYTLYTLSGAPREAFASFPMPRNTEIFEPTFRGRGPVRSADILADPRYGKNAPYHGMPKGHLPVRSYLAVPVLSRNGDVLGGLFFGHAQPGIFTERGERLVVGLAGQAAVAIDNARLYAARKDAETKLQEVNSNLEQRAEQRARELAAAAISLEESERRFKILVEGVTDYAIYLLDPTGTIINWNQGAQRIKGYAAPEVIGQNFARFYTEEDRQSGLPARALATAERTGKFESEGWRVKKTATGSGLASSSTRSATRRASWPDLPRLPVISPSAVQQRRSCNNHKKWKASAS